MCNVLSIPTKLRAAVYIRVGSMEQYFSEKLQSRNVKASTTMSNKSKVILEQFMDARYDYEKLSTVYSIIKEKNYM